jgi:hypothetical protein
MRKVQGLVLVLATLLGLAALPLLQGHGDQPKKEKVSELMRRKLENSQKVLEALALNDFDKIAHHAEELLDISKQVEWQVIQTPMYEVHSNDFRRCAESMAKDAKNKNLDGAALNYVEMTLTCVKCHKHVRETRRTSLDLPLREPRS